MNYITTNVRLPKEEYEDLKKIAFSQNKSLASLIREATREYKNKSLNNRKARKSLYKLITSSAVEIDVPVTELVHSGRKFE
ncbi:MAG: CopG family transcriptional regulator [Patescibacteria group bacterium]